MRLSVSPRGLLLGWSWLCLALALTAAAPASAQQSGTSAEAAPLTQLLEVLRDDQQRATLVEALERAQAAPDEATPASGEAQESAAGDAETPQDGVVQGGVLGALTSTLDSLQQNLGEGNEVVSDWQYHLGRASQQLSELGHRVGQSPLQVSTRFSYTMIFWAISMLAACWLGARIAARLSRWAWFSTHRRARDIVEHWLRVPLPAITAFLLTLAATSGFGADSPGRMLALGIAYAVNTGTVFATLWMSLAILARGSHRKRAVEILRRRAFIPLATLAAFGSFAEALLNSPLTALLGYSLAYLLATLCGAIATIILAVFAVMFRRPIGQLIHHRGLAHRQRLPPSVRESLRLFSAIWFLPVLLMCLVSLYQLLIGSVDNHQAMNRMITSTLLLIGTLLIMALLHQLVAPPDLAPRERMGTRMRRLAANALQIALLALAAELMTQIWGGSIYGLIRDTEAGQMFGGAVFGIAMVLLVTLAAWIVIDAAIASALAPPSGRRHAQPSLRVRTILPLLRNAAKIVLCVIAVITVLGNVGINIAPLLAGAGVVGLAIGFGSQTLVQDVITGIFNILEDTMAIGDWVEIDGRAGTVEGMTIRTLKLRDGNGALFSIPFSQVKAVKNTSRQFAFAPVDLRFTLDSDIDHALELVRQAADQTQQDPTLRGALLGHYENWGLERVNAEGYNVAGRFRATTGGAANVRRAFYLHLARLVENAEAVSFARGYVGGR